MPLPRRRKILAALFIGVVGWFPLQGCTCYQLKTETCEVGIQLTSSGEIKVKKTIKLHVNQQGVRWFAKTPVPGLKIKVEWDPTPPPDGNYDNADGLPFEILCKELECVSDRKATRKGTFKYQVTVTPPVGNPIVLDPDVVVMD